MIGQLGCLQDLREALLHPVEEEEEKRRGKGEENLVKADQKFIKI